jgi:hypothetical protein
MSLSKLDESRNKVAMLKEHQHEILQDDESAFAAIVNTLSVEMIDNMTGEEILKLNNYEEGKYFVGEPDFESGEDLVEYVRAVIRFLVQAYTFTQEMDAMVKEVDEIASETTNAIKESLGFDSSDESVTSVEVIKKAIEDNLEQAKQSGDMVKYNSILQSKVTFEETFTLDRIKSLYLTLDPSNLKEDATSERSMTIYKNYLKVQQKLGSRYDLIKVNDVEVRFLPEKYHESNNLFIIAVIKYISKLMKDGYYSSDDAFFVSQLTTNLFMLHLDILPNEYREVLVKNIQEFLDILNR